MLHIKGTFVSNKKKGDNFNTLKGRFQGEKL